MSDTELLRRSAGGDQDAFAEFVSQHIGPLYRFLLSLEASPDQADDALQDCLVSAWRSAGGFSGPSSARSWLFSIARNALRRQYRRRVGEPKQMESLEALAESAGWGSVEDPLASLEARDSVSRALGFLSDEEREVIVLRDLEGFTGIETAQILSMSVPAVKSRLHRGRLRLLGALRAQERRDNA